MPATSFLMTFAIEWTVSTGDYYRLDYAGCEMLPVNIGRAA
jgi:hypothetical protein